MGAISKKRPLALLGATVLALAVLTATALAADPTDRSFGDDGIAEVEAFLPEKGAAPEQVGGIVDLEPARGGKMLAAVYGIARGGYYFAAARINRNGSLDRSFGQEGFTPYIDVHQRTGRGLQAEAVAEQKDGDVVVAGYLDIRGATAPALARFTRAGRLDRSFGHGGKLIPKPSLGGRRVGGGEPGGERLHDVAIAPKGGDIIAVGGVNEEGGPRRDPNPAALVVAYRPDGKVDRRFGHHGRFKVKVPRRNAYTGFTEVEALPSGKLLVSGYVKGQLVLYRLTAGGRRDRSFGGGDGKVTVGRPTAEAPQTVIRAPFAVDRRGRIALGGVIVGRTTFDPGPVVLLRLLPDGRRDPSFRRSIYIERAPADEAEPFPRRHVESFHFEPQAVAIDGHSRIVLTGIELAPYKRGQEEGGYQYFTSRRFRPDGRRDRGFGHGGVWNTDPLGSQSMARAAVTQPDGKVVAGGWVQIERFGGNGPGNTAMMLTRYR